MCGIAVAVDWQDAEAVVRQLIQGILHRGDITDPLVSPRAEQRHGHAAPASSMLRRAVQPVLHDGRLLVSLTAKSTITPVAPASWSKRASPFRTQSDTEVLANALQVWGAAGAQAVKGMFAFVVVDTETGEFLAARDPFGVKPLYLIQSGQGFLFCSEITPLAGRQCPAPK